MKVKCKNCLPTEGIEIPDFSQSQKIKLKELTMLSPLRSTKYKIDNFAISHRDSKFIATHINKTYGHCSRCKFDNLNEEYMNCPECGILNFNWQTENGNQI